MSDEPAKLRPVDVARALGISRVYAWQLVNNDRPFSRAHAIKLFRATGHKLGPIADASDAEIAILERFEPAETSKGAAA